MKSLKPFNQQRYNLLPFEVEFRLYASAVIKLSPISLKNYISDYRYFTGWLIATYQNVTVESVSETHLLAYKAYLQGQGLPRASVNRRLSALRAVYAFLVQQHIVTENPMKHIKNMTEHGNTPESSAHSPSILDEYAQFLVEEKYDPNHMDQILADNSEFLLFIHQQ